MSIQEISKLANEFAEDNRFLEMLSRDSREGVRKLYRQIMTKREKDQLELLRLTEMTKLERDLWCSGMTLVAGVDEVGRGPLAGPVVAGAVILPPGCRIVGLNDSKKLSEKTREMLFEEIARVAVAWSIGMASPAEIDQVNILQATYIAMQRALTSLPQLPQYLLVDAVTIPAITIPQSGIIGGDGLSLSIAAASVMAKVTRDRLMTTQDQLYPGYCFAKHKGYGTQEHYEAIRRCGLSPIHRRSFCHF
ncbi:MAG TPA: ribonuclease HII [Bacillota bacterium]|nr:ribonuclease HII [Bacillota bacterium]